MFSKLYLLLKKIRTGLFFQRTKAIVLLLWTNMIIARRLFQAARSRPRQIGLVEVFSTINLCLNLLNCNKFIQRILQDMLILKLLIWTSLFWPSSSRCRHLFAKGPFCQSQNARHKSFYSKASLLPYSWKKHVQFYQCGQTFSAVITKRCAEILPNWIFFYQTRANSAFWNFWLRASHCSHVLHPSWRQHNETVK
jgi:hypothetical protein